MTIFESDDIDDEIPDFDNPDAPRPKREPAEMVLAREALDSALNRQSRRILKRHPGIFIVHVPHADWAEMMAKAVKRMDNAPVVKIVTERHKRGGVFNRVGSDELKYAQHGRSILYVSQDPSGLLDEAVLAVADLTISIPPPTPALLRKVIRGVTGGVARGVVAGMAGLDLPVITSSVRLELTAQKCVLNLQRALARKAEPSVSSVPLLDSLPLTHDMRAWANRTLADLQAVKAGTIHSDQLLFGVLEGPPGTGKTLIAESLALSAGWSFVPANVGKMFTTGDGALGGVARNLKTFFDQLNAQQPAVGFLDEIESFPNRATMDNRGRDWWTPVVTLFLTEIDEVRKSGKPILLLGATNYYSRLDSALVRPGRLHQRISVLPSSSEDEVIALLRYYLGDDLPDGDLSRLGRVGRGATPATVEGWLKEARSEARHQNRKLVLSDILDRILPQDDRIPADIHAIALHEVGHAVVAHRLGQVVESISIIPEGASGGRTWTLLPTIVPTWTVLLDRATVMLAGRAADVTLGAGPNAGAEADLAGATELVLAGYQRQGLRDSLVFMPGTVVPSATTIKAVDTELHRLLARAITIIKDNRDLVLHLTDRLIEERVLAGSEVAHVLGAHSTREERWHKMPPVKAPALRRAVTDADPDEMMRPD